ncbi:hypothetical protein K6119_17410 [Paracrocinitomix mangrovi]|uniref:hypothetical protein n=1 Tax=Paracrocinitomix mangrovi TaxID=2862509 RepID=UPI001C8EF39F|nr:hypothetical protein [Paracrocinitomix mangrovi]UKN01505.1 hypothetical protein K6119_17410 [Paracrocinitomix mangrovi]
MTKFIGDRISMEDHERSSTVVILPKRVRWKDILLISWVVGFTFAGLYIVYLLFFGGINELKVGVNYDEEIRKQQVIYLAIFTGFWVYFEYLTLKTVLWYLFGKELIQIDTEALTFKRSTLSYGKANRYFFENIKKIEYIKPDDTSLNQFLTNAYWSLGADAIKIYTKGKEKTFGRRLSEKEAKRLLKFINERSKKWRKK